MKSIKVILLPWLSVLIPKIIGLIPVLEAMSYFFGIIVSILIISKSIWKQKQKD